MRNTGQYKGFTASVHFSVADMVFHGKIVFITDLVTFEGVTVEELVRAFEEAVKTLSGCERSFINTAEKFDGHV